MRRHARLVLGLLCTSMLGAPPAATAAVVAEVAMPARLPGVTAAVVAEGAAEGPLAAVATTAPRDPPLALVVEPDAGPGPLYGLLASPRRSLELVVYELEDPRVESILAADARRGVEVRVLLDRAYVGRYNRAAYGYLASHGVAVRWAPPSFDLTHEKAIVVDGRLAAVMTLNLTARYYKTSRDFAVLDRQRADVAAIGATFDGDWRLAAGQRAAGSPARPAVAASAGRDLVWSPGASGAVLALISSARHALLVEDEEMRDPQVIAALCQAARRGVAVEVVMTADPEWDGAFARLAAAGATVRTYPYSASALYIHAKAIVADPGRPGARVMVGSQNFSVASLDYNRELAVVTTAPSIAAGVASTIARDLAGAPSPA